MVFPLTKKGNAKMRLASFRQGARRSYGLVVPEGIVDLGADGAPDLQAALASMTPEEIRSGTQRSSRLVEQGGFEWLPPIVAPEKILCVGHNYRRHVAEIGAALPNHPSFFVRFPSSQVGHEQPIVRPAASEMYDFEGELAVVIGREARHVAPERALEHVAGYACFAENSVRDFQSHSGQATAGKNFERSGAFGPWLVTTDEVADIADMTLVTRLNGQEVQRSDLDDLIFSIPELIAYASRFTRLKPGDVIVTGTPSGVGSARKPPLWMKAGDVLEVEISKIGVLRNPVVDEMAP
jgi:2-keto-4-pentenoate hydratase/2-oxohepta-3-ene-1,7-dioic acid hydratase in catechol pathway